MVTLQLQDLHTPDASGLVRLRVRGKDDKERVVGLTAETHRHLQCWLQARPSTEQERLFLNQRGTALSVAGVQYRLKQYCQQAGVQLTCHPAIPGGELRGGERALPVVATVSRSGRLAAQEALPGAPPALGAGGLRGCHRGGGPSCQDGVAEGKRYAVASS